MTKVDQGLLIAAMVAVVAIVGMVMIVTADAPSAAMGARTSDNHNAWEDEYRLHCPPHEPLSAECQAALEAKWNSEIH